MIQHVRACIEGLGSSAFGVHLPPGLAARENCRLMEVKNVSYILVDVSAFDEFRDLKRIFPRSSSAAIRAPVDVGWAPLDGETRNAVWKQSDPYCSVCIPWMVISTAVYFATHRTRLGMNPYNDMPPPPGTHALFEEVILSSALSYTSAIGAVITAATTRLWIMTYTIDNNFLTELLLAKIAFNGLLDLRVVVDAGRIKGNSPRLIRLFLANVIGLGGRAFAWSPPRNGRRAQKIFPPFLHAKVILTEEHVISGSKNITRNGLIAIDAGVLTSDHSARRASEKAFLEVFAGSAELVLEDLTEFEVPANFGLQDLSPRFNNRDMIDAVAYAPDPLT